jgi:hypothetical protein
VAELVDAPVLGTGRETCGGSSPLPGTERSEIMIETCAGGICIGREGCALCEERTPAHPGPKGSPLPGTRTVDHTLIRYENYLKLKKQSYISAVAFSGTLVFISDML